MPEAQPFVKISPVWLWGIPIVLAGAMLALILTWLNLGPAEAVTLRLPVEYDRTQQTETSRSYHDGKLTAGPGTPAERSGTWPAFRGSNRDNIANWPGQLTEQLTAGSLPVKWSAKLGEGYAGAAVHAGRAYLTDYDAGAEMDVLRCLSLADGQEIWQYAYPVKVKRNHGMSRTVPAVTEDYVVSFGPKCHVLVCDAKTGEKKWIVDLVDKYGSVVPPWYAGQCPLIDEGKLILAPAGPKVMLNAIDLETGEAIWQTPNDFGWKMSHASVVPMTLADGRRSYVYVAAGGVLAVDAKTGKVLWSTDAWQIKVATVPSAVPVGEDRVFLAGGYGAGAMMLRLLPEGEGYRAEVEWQVDQSVFGSAQQSPIFAEGHLFGVRPSGELVCLNLEGKEVWTSGRAERFGLGPYLVVGDQLLVMDDDGVLTAAKLSTRGYEKLWSADVLDGHDSWAPMAFADGLLLVRDLTEMRCVVLGEE